MDAVVIIPARLESSRFPGKPLVPLGKNQKPLIRHVWERALGSRLSSAAVIATDSAEIFKTALSFGAKAVMTAPHHPSGTDRVAEAAAGLEASIIVNLQGDEPLIRAEMIDDVISLLMEDKGADIGTLAKKIETVEDFNDPNVVKVVFDARGFALYFSRSPIPHHGGYGGSRRDLPPGEGFGFFQAFKHIGIYAYRREALFRLTRLKPTRLEQLERLEQLRALEHGMPVKVGQTSFETIGVDTPEDLRKVEKWLNTYS